MEKILPVANSISINLLEIIKMRTIRKAKPEDASSIIDFQEKMAWETEHITLEKQVITDGVKAVFANPSLGQYWVSEKDGMVIASLLITYEWSDWRNSNIWWLQSVYVIPAFRRNGIFRSMYSHIKDEVNKQGAAGLRLYVEINNSGAHLAYESLGMKSEHYNMYEWMKD